MNKKIISLVLLVVIVGVGSFYAGMKYNQNQRTANRGAGNFANLSPEERQARATAGGFVGMGQSGRAGGGNGLAVGEVISADDKSITIKLRDGGSQIIFFTPNTPITKSVSGSASDIAVGEQVTVSGAKNQDGSISAQSIQIRPSIEASPR
ncbi:MAG: DUF5666 domain-containing protein [Patescibacteria group bacterium]